MVDGGSSGAVVLNMWFLDREHQHHLETFLKCSFWDPIPYLLDQKLGRWKPAICVVFVVNLLTIYWVVNCCSHCWNLRLTHPDPSLGFPLKRKPGAEPPQSPEGRKKTCEGMQEDGRREAEPGCKVRLLGTHTLSHRQRPGVSISPQSMAMRTLGKDQVSTRHLSPSCHEASAKRGWAKVIGLCLQGTWGLSQSSFDGGHHLQKLALHVHVAIASLLGVNQLPCYEHFKGASDLASPLAANVQASREPIF